MSTDSTQLHSLSLQTRSTKNFSWSLTPTIFFEYGSVQSLAEYVVAAYQGEWNQDTTAKGIDERTNSLHSLNSLEASLSNMVSAILKVNSEDIDVNTEPE